MNKIPRHEQERLDSFERGVKEGMKLALQTLRKLRLNYGCEGGISPEEYYQYLDKELKGVKGFWSPDPENDTL